MILPDSKMLKLTFSAIAAIAVNAVIFFQLGNLDRPKTLRSETPPLSHVLTQPEISKPTETVKNTTEEHKPETIVMTTNLDLPTMEPVALEPLDAPLDISIPTLSTVKIPIQRKEPVKEAPVEKPQAQNNDEPAQPEGPKDAEQVDSPPRPRYSPKPDYPRKALLRNIEGSVRVRILIDENGKVEKVETLRCEGHDDFEAAVLKTVSNWRFEPAVHQGKKVKVWGVKLFQFKIED